MNIQQMMKQAQDLQKKFTEAQDEMHKMEVIGESGGGMVKVTISGKLDLKKIKIDDSLLNVDEKDMMEDLIVAAFNNAKQNVEAASSEHMSKHGISPDILKMMP